MQGTLALRSAGDCVIERHRQVAWSPRRITIIGSTRPTTASNIHLFHSHSIATTADGFFSLLMRRRSILVRVLRLEMRLFCGASDLRV